ncbi:protein WUSCHEL-like [Rosa chinensis]|uniref:protein WUSCHEL-like n=1 Tax=Rosa chinensis TaxID=74649 RepID=UPI000D092A16|nr:protein WUSCHEL-like [Rosa chinensis]
MEPQNRHPIEDGGSNKAAESSPNMHCKQSNTRWLPTRDQIRILKELYDDKNVFYWFQNQRAREKLKNNKLTSDVQVPKQRSGLVGGSINLNFGSTSSAGVGGSIMEQRGEDH